MDIHQNPQRNITLKDEIICTAEIQSSLDQKKLRRLPHMFCKVLELPFNSEVRVAVEESEECFRFVVSGVEALALQEARVEIIEIVPRSIKVVIGDANGRSRILNDDVEWDLWRFRLPSSTLPELSTAVYSDGEFVVTVPKDVAVTETEADFNGDDSGVAFFPKLRRQLYAPRR